MMMIRRMATAAVLLFTGSMAMAQYDEPREFSQLEARFIAAGVLDRDFHRGSGNPLGDSATIGYRVWMPMLSFHQGPVSVSFGYTRYQRDGESKEAVHFGTVLTNDLGISSRTASTFSIPICLAADFTKAEATGPKRDNFNIASLGAGAGMRYQYRSPSFDAGLSALGIFHFAFEGLGTGSGSSKALDCDVRLLFKSMHIGDGLVVGYRLRAQRWDMSDERFNYTSIHHGPYLGVMF
jgi:hypothetical protein